MSRRARPTAPPVTDLARLCRYYLDCLARDADQGVTVAPADRAAYAELASMPLLSREPAVHDEPALELLGRIALDQTSIGQLGYLMVLRSADGPGDKVSLRLEPILLWPMDTQGTVQEAIPDLNLAALGALSSAEGMRPFDEKIRLSHDLGLAGEPADVPGFDELILKLRRVRPNWPWREPPDPYRLAREPAVETIDQPGIYNRCLVVQGTRSTYTRGLEFELGRLAGLPEQEIAGTALGNWLRGAPLGEKASSGEPLLEVLPLNEEQRQAVRKALVNGLTVVTGPPGTGKSQLVAALLANAAWRGQKVLFASKNNKAVDVVEDRVNRLGPRPLLLRLGRNHEQLLEEYLSSLLAATVDSEDEADYQRGLEVQERLRAEDAELRSEVDTVVALRNEVDRLEQASEQARKRLGEPAFRKLAANQLGPWGLAVDAFLEAGSEALCTRRFRPFLQMIDRLRDAKTAVNYSRRLADLRHARTPTAIAADRRVLLEKIVSNSIRLWNAWLRVLPGRIPHPARGCPATFAGVLRMLRDVAGGARDGNRDAFKNLMRQYYRLFLKVARHLPAWAVTSLSARGRLPLEPATFDLAIIDEASQCDIASAIPLLYRAKRAVIIGDPKQLTHIARIGRAEDGLLLDRHGLLEARANWAYATNSLYDLASSLVGPDQIVMLRDHFRSHRAIIGFSNAVFYDGRLRMATRVGSLRRPQRNGQPEAAVTWHNVPGKVLRPREGGAVNPAEAEAVVRQLRRMVLDLGYTGSIGVVSPFRAQANRIKQLVQIDDMLSKRLYAQDFVADTANGFQGDERDVMLFSPVVSDQTPPGALWFLRNEPNLFNVAVTRARAALIVVGDHSEALRSKVDYLCRFARYVAAMSDWSPPPTPLADDPGPIYPPVRHPERVSEWERFFLRGALRSGPATNSSIRLRWHDPGLRVARWRPPPRDRGRRRDVPPGLGWRLLPPGSGAELALDGGRLGRSARVGL
jgi:AAA domain